MNSPELKKRLCRVVIDNAQTLHATNAEVSMAEQALGNPKAVRNQLGHHGYPDRCIEYIYNNFYTLAKDHGLIS